MNNNNNIANNNNNNNNNNNKKKNNNNNDISYLWIANCVLYSVLTAFLLYKGWKKQGSNRSSDHKSKDQSGK